MLLTAVYKTDLKAAKHDNPASFVIVRDRFEYRDGILTVNLIIEYQVAFWTLETTRPVPDRP